MKIKASLKIATLFLLFLLPFTSKAQLDLIHYVPPLYAGTTNEKDIEDHWVVLTTPSENPIEVTIKRGDGTIFKIVTGVSINNPKKVALNEGYKGTLSNTPLGVVNYTSLNKPIKDQGLIFTSTEAFYVNIRHKSEIHGLSLTAKGQAGLGKSFRSGHLHSVRGAKSVNGWGDGGNSDYWDWIDGGWVWIEDSKIVNHRSHFISVMATEDNTVVSFSDIQVGNLTSDSRTALHVSDITTDVNTANSVFDFTDDGVFNVVLNEGESYVLGANHEFLTPDDVNKFNGTKISSDKPIAVNSGSWCGSASTSNKQDIGVDQIVPEKLVGNEYILIKGQGNDGSECPVVVATKDGTNITVNGISGIINPTPLNAGDSYPIESKHFDRDEGTMLINTNHNVYVYQTTAASKDKPYPTIGMNFIPPLSSLGFRQVDIPFINELGTGIVAIYSQKGADVFVNNSTTPLDQASAKLVKGKDEWVVYEYSTSDENVSVMSDKAIYVALSVFDNVVGAAGYFSGFTKSISPINPEVVFNYDLGYICSNKEGYLDLKINSTPNPDWYEWYHDIIHPDSIKNPNENLFVPVPKKATKYILKAYFRDPNMDILYNGDFAIGRGRFESDFDFNYISRLDDPGKAVLCSNPKSVNTGFSDFEDVHDERTPEGKMLLAHSSGSGNADVLWRKTLTSSIDIPDNLFILKFYGRLAHKVDDKYSDQYLDVFVNDEKVYSNFQLNDTEAWKSVKAFWRAGKAESATIKIVDANASGKQSVFAIDSISFVPAVEAVKEFNPDVVPSYSYTPYDKGIHFCEGAEQAVANIKYGDMEWFTFSWEKKSSDNTFVPITDSSIEGIDTYELKFNNVVDDHAGIYRCTIDFKKTYEQCGIDVEPTSVEVEIFVDKTASLDPLEGKTELCEGLPTNITATVSGEFSIIEWSVSKKEGGEIITSYSGPENVFKFNSELNYPAGEYIVRCEVVNGCSEDLFKEIEIKILGMAKLKSLIIPTDQLCEIKEITLDAILESDYILDNSIIEYSWYKNGESTSMGITTVPSYKITPGLNDKSYKVLVNTHYDFGPTNQFTCEGNFIEENLATNPVHPEVKLIGLNSDPVCEGIPHTYSVNLKPISSSYSYKWDVPDGAKVNKDPEDYEGSSFAVGPVNLDKIGNYTVTVTNKCGDVSATSKLEMKPKLLVYPVSLSEEGPYCLGDNLGVTVEDNGNASGYYAENLTTGKIVDPVNKTFDITVDASTVGQWRVTAKNSCGDKETPNFSIDLADSFSEPKIAPRKACLGDNVTLVAVVETQPVGTKLTYQWKDQSGIDIPEENNSSLEIKGVKSTDAGEYTCVVSDGICSTKEAKGILSVDDITIENLKPESVSKCQGESYRFDIPYVGKPTFAWFFTGVDNVKKNLNISTSFYDTPSLVVAHAGLYSCEITTSCGLKVFKQSLNVLTNVVVTKDAAVVTDICEGEHTTLILNLTGSYESIKWYKEGSELTGELDKRVISTGELETSGTFRYKYIVEGSCGPVEGTFDVVVHEKPVLSALDNNMEECAGLVELKITESGEHNGISWWKNDVEITDGNAEPTNYVIDPATSPADDGNYIAKVSSEHCGDDQVSINLDVRNNIIVTDQSPATTTVCENEIVSLSVSADGDDIEFNWYNTAAPKVSLSDLPTLDLGSVSISTAGTYKVSLTNDLNCNNQILSFDLVVNKNPSVTNPDDKVICETIVSVDFTVAGDAQGVANYQWFNNDGEIVGATNPTYTENAPEDGQAYYCEVTGTVGFCGKATSEKATLTVIQEVSVTNPLDQNIADGANALFKVTASGEPNFSYQWEENSGSGWNSIVDGGKYSGATTAELKITNADKVNFDENQYRCVVNSDGAICSSNVTSNSATLTINSVLKTASHPSSTTACNGADVDLTIEGYFDALTYTWQYDNGGGTYVNADGVASMSASTVGKTSTLTIPSVNTGMNSWEFRCLVSDGTSTNEYSNIVTVTVLEDIAVSTVDANFTPCLDEPFSLSVVKTAGDDIKYKWYRDNVIIVGATNSTYNFGNIALADGGEYKCEIYNDLHCNDITRTFNVDVLELATVVDPSDFTMCSTDANPSFKVTAGGDGPFDYQWFNSAGIIAGAESNTYTETTPVDGETYYCEVSSSCNTLVSTSALLTVIEPLSVIDPSDLTIADGADATFTVTASGEPNYTYQWQENDGGVWSNLADAGKYSGSNTASLVISNALKADFNGYKYRCIVNTDGLVCIPSVTSGFATLTINSVVKIAVQANDAEICFGGNATISVEGTSDALTYTWQYDNGGGTYVNADGVASMSAAVAGKVSTLTIPGTDLDINNWTFKCLVSDGISTDEFSQEVSVKVLEDISVTPGLLNHVLCENEALSMSVVATAGDDILYKWYNDATPAIILSTNSTFNIGNVVLADEGNYTCEIYNLKGCNDQIVNFALDVQEHVSTSDPVDKIMCSTDANPVFTVVAFGDAPYFYKWFNSAGEIVGATNASYTEITPVDGESYYCEVSNTCNTVVSKSADLVVIEPLAVTNPVNLEIADGGNAEFTVVASGEPNYSYQWQVLDGIWKDISDVDKYSGTITAELKITNADQATYNGKQYRCVVSTDGIVCIPSITSNSATLTINAVDKILNQPTDVEVCFNDNATLSVEGASAGLTYIWYYKKGAGAYETAIGKDGITVGLVGNVSTLTVPANDLDINNWKFQCTVDDLSSTEEYSAEVTITVLEDIAVSTIDEDFTPCIDSPFSLSVNTTARDDIKFKWYKVGEEAIILSTHDTYNFGNIVIADEGEYKCEIYNDLGCNDITRTFNVDVLELATVVDPSDFTMCSTDANPTFTVTAGGDGPFDYQWFNSAGIIAGAESNTYTETTPVDSESYYCEITTGCNTIASKTALLTVTEPLSVTNPSDLTIADGANATFEVVASGEPNYSYQWEEKSGSGWSSITDGGKYSGATTAELKITNALEADFNGNQYRCIVNTDGGFCISSVTSGSAILSINTIIKIAVQADDAEICFGDNATISVEGTSDGLTYTWEYDNGGGTFVNADGVASMSAAVAGKVSTLTIPGNNLDINNWTFRCLVSDALSTDEYSQLFKVRVLEDIAVTPGLLAHVLCENEALSMSVVATAGDDILYKWYNDATPATILSTNATFNIGNVVLADKGSYTCEIYNLKGCNDQTINFTLDVQEHATVSTLLDEEMCTSDVAPTFTVIAGGDAPFDYQWFNSAGIIAGAESNTYTETTPVDGESYYCEVTNNCNTIASNVAILTVNEEVAIITQPIASSILDGADATFSVTASGEPVLTYQWQEDSGSGFNDIIDNAVYSGANSATLTITDVDRATFNGNKYRCKVDNGCSAEQISDEVDLTVNALIKILTPLSDIQACLNDEVYFEIVGTTPVLDYAWEYENGSGTFVNAEGVLGMSEVLTANGSKLKINHVSLAMEAWTFRCIVKDGSSTDDISNVVSMEVFEPIEITPIDNQELCFDESKQITLDVTSGTEPYTYSWTKDATEVSTTAIVNIGGSDNGNYKVIASNGGVCPDKSSDFIVSHYSALSIDTWANVDQICLGKTVTLTATVNVDPDKSATTIYEWFKDDVRLGITPDENFTLVVTDKNQTGQYKLVVFDGCSTESVSGYINIYEPITTTNVWDATDEFCVGNELNLEVQLTGDVKSYTWTLNGVSLTASTTYLVASVTDTDKGTYICTIEDYCGNTKEYKTEISIIDIPSIDLPGIENLSEVCEGKQLEIGAINVDGLVDYITWEAPVGVSGTLEDDDKMYNLGAATPEMEGNYKVTVKNQCGKDVSVGTQIVNPTPTLASIENQIVCQNEGVVFRAEATGRDLHYKWKVDGVDQATDAAELIIDGTEVLPDDPFNPGTYNVECIVTNGNGCGDILNESAQLVVNPSTILYTSLKGEVVYVGKDHEFDVDVTGGNLVYEWHHIHTDGTDETLLETTKTLNLNNLSMVDAGEYTCKITGDCGVRFTSGYLTIKDPMKIVEGLTETNIEKCFGEPLNLNISVNGEVFLINWFKGDKNLGHHGLSYSIPSLDVSDTGLYRCVIVGEGTSLEESVDVKVYKTTVLNSDIEDKELCEKENLSWIPDVSGSVLVYDWQYGGKTVSTESTFSIADLTLGASGKYSVDITGKCGSVNTEANLLVKKLPEYISKSDDLETCENDPEALFVVEFLGDNLVYQWQKDNVDIPDATSTELRLQNLRTSDAASYKCLVNSSCGVAVESPEMKLVVIPQLKVLSESPGMEICDGENAQFLVEVKGTDEVYQWQKDGVDITGEKAPQLMIDPASLTEEGYYNCKITDKCTKGVKRYSNAKKLTVNALPNSKIIGRMTLCVLEDRVAYNTTLQPDINYGWLVEGGEFSSPTEGLRTKITWGDVIEDGKVKLKILDESTGCYSQVDSLVKLRPLPDVKLTTLETKGICEPEFELTGGLPVGGIYWVNGVSQNTFDPSQGNGEYQIRYSYTDDLGCSNSTGELLMKVDSLPIVKLIEDVVVGSCETRVLSAETEESNIKWSPSRYLDDPNSETPTFTAGETTLYVATVVDKFGCVGNDIVNVTVAPLPIITTINDTIIGECKEIELTTHISGDVEEINWTNSSDLDNSKNSNPKLIKRRLGVNDYQINVTDEYGCIGSASIKVEVLPNPVVGENQFLCEGETLLVDTKDLSNPVWEDGYTAWERTIEKPGEYKLSVEQNDCKLEQKIVMNPLPKFELDNTVQPGIVIFEGETLTLNPDLDPDYGPYVYDWSDGSVLSQLEVVESGTYKLKVEDNIGCIAKDSVVVEVKPIGIESPNAFTPLSNNENDHFYLKNINVIEKFEMYIYNRWGELLYKTNKAGYADGWDGTYKGEDCPVGAYVWVVMLDGEMKEKGTVILVR